MPYQIDAKRNDCRVCFHFEFRKAPGNTLKVGREVSLALSDPFYGKKVRNWPM